MAKLIKIYTQAESLAGLASKWGKGLIVTRHEKTFYDKPYQCIGMEINGNKIVQHSDGKTGPRW